MPTYSYACKGCENRFDIHQSFSDDALTECPDCSGSLRKLFNAVGVVFKGSGFYRNDSRNEAGTKSPAKPTGDSANGGSGAGKAGTDKAAKGSGSGDSGSSSSDSGSSSATSSSSSAAASSSSKGSTGGTAA